MADPAHILRITPHFRRAGTWPVAFDPIGGLQTQTWRLTKAIDRRGHRQTVLTSHIPGARRHVQVSKAAQAISLGPDLPGWLASRTHGLSWFPAVLWSLWRHRKTVDLVHIHYNHWIWCRLLTVAARAMGKPVVVSFNTDLWVSKLAARPKPGLLHGLALRVERATLRHAHRVIALTNTQADQLATDLAIPRNRLSIVPDAIDAPAYRDALDRSGLDGFRNAFQIPPDRQIVVYIGRIRTEKGWDILPPLSQALTKQDAFLLICGDGPDRQQLAAALRKSSDPSNWRITGFLDTAQIRIALEHADLLVLPSRRDAFGSVLLEAMACGVASVACKVGGIPDLAGSPSAVCLIDPNDPPAFIDGVTSLLSDPAARAALAARGSNRVKQFTLQHAADATIDCYDTLLPRCIETAQQPRVATNPTAS